MLDILPWVQESGTSLAPRLQRYAMKNCHYTMSRLATSPIAKAVNTAVQPKKPRPQAQVGDRLPWVVASGRFACEDREKNQRDARSDNNDPARRQRTLEV
jgi:hypothetical protein